MVKKKKNKVLPLIIMAGVLAALIVGYAVLSSYNAKKAEEEADTESSTIEVLKKDKAIPVSVSYKVEDTTLSFSYVNEKWTYPADETFPLNSAAVATMVAGLTDIKAASIVDLEGADVDSFGLESPAQTLKVAFSDGTDYTLQFGIVNTYNGQQYMSISQSENVYLVESSMASGFSKKLSDLFASEIWTLQNDAVTAEDITSVVIESADGQTNTVDNEKGVEELFNLVYKLNLSNWEDHYADETEMKETYGIYPEGDRVTLNYTKSTTITNDDGTKTTADIPASYTVYFGYEFEIAEDEAEETTSAENDTTASEDEGPEMKFFYTQKGSTVVYSKEKNVADDIFEYLSYTAPEETTNAE